ncbi:MAG: hypothetical protein ACFFKA_04530 [Candidatus Thorarchaeota archaeon]
MNFAVPRESLTEMVLYIWKIINYPQISLDDLIFKISFELFLFNPNEAKFFIEKAIKGRFLSKASDNIIKLTNSLETRLIEWQRIQKIDFKNKLYQLRNQDQTRKEFLEENDNHFNVLLKALLDKGTINRAAAISDDTFEITTFSPKESKIVANVKGSKEIPYHIIIDINNKVISHNCNDFETKRAQNYKFCKHLAKLFLLLKKENEDWVNQVLEKIINNIEEWSFSA